MLSLYALHDIHVRSASWEAVTIMFRCDIVDVMVSLIGGEKRQRISEAANVLGNCYGADVGYRNLNRWWIQKSEQMLDTEILTDGG